MINLLHRYGKFVTTHKKNHTLKVNALCSTGTKFVCRSSEFLRADSSVQNAIRTIRSCIQLNVVNFGLHPNSQTKSDGMRSGEQNDPCSCKFFCNND
jgi:hypothetical protein